MQPQTLDVCLLNDSWLHMYTGLNCTVFKILLKWLEPVPPSYAEEMQGMHHDVRNHLTTS